MNEHDIEQPEITSIADLADPAVQKWLQKHRDVRFIRNLVDRTAQQDNEQFEEKPYNA